MNLSELSNFLFVCIILNTEVILFLGLIFFYTWRNWSEAYSGLFFLIVFPLLWMKKKVNQYYVSLKPLIISLQCRVITVFSATKCTWVRHQYLKISNPYDVLCQEMYWHLERCLNASWQVFKERKINYCTNIY